MAKSKKQAYIAVPSQVITSLSSNSLQNLLLSPKKSSKNKPRKCFYSPKTCLFFLFVFALLGMLNMWIRLGHIGSFSTNPCGIIAQDSFLSHGFVSKLETSNLLVKKEEEKVVKKVAKKVVKKSGFWEQPDGLGYRPCLEFSRDYRKYNEGIIKDRKKYLAVVVSGGMNQQRNQIVDAVVIARILGAALVVPILQVNVIWGDESEFADIFDLENFKDVLANDVRIVSALPSTHIMSRPVEEKLMPGHVTPQWIRSRYLRKFKRYGVVLLRGLDSRLTKDLPSDLQKLRCKVAFHALKFAPKILELGNRFTERMRVKGPYVALHLRMEIDVWVRTGCLPGLNSEYDEMIITERKLRPELLTSKSNKTSHERKLAGLCPLSAHEVTRLLKALGAPRDTRIYWAGGNPLGGKDALLPLRSEFPNLYNKDDLALPGELEPYQGKASFMAAIDYIVAENSDVFMPSHGGNMGHALQGHRAYAGHRKYITPNKRKMLPYFLDSSLPEAEFNKIIIDLHRDSLGQPNLRTSKLGRDVTKFPIPECMCNDSKLDTSL